ncbi:hypothetical protein CJF42_19520 [Pseudoalteromonas sp. NBT06-2]|uniref:DUF1697 domain-containing protein n=1 Tax=Pseudoalteromonas sp. NBT06-2 TaxID=2025950 RepID=UPI000BA624F8|nr:DUF1697 domain-containing protein [Pseudoalteromonas sp. NBT06-2]PAJ72744.1 hypothetical protein CJF42_19520 [Pseudoalteromonas sp. NBT06-2]
MSRYISILRGINVSGQKKIVMKELKSLYESLGFENVVTYIQSGNVIFDSVIENVENIQRTIADAIKTKYDFEVPVDVRTSNQFKQVLACLPFDEVNLEADGTKMLVTFLTQQPQNDAFDSLMEYVNEPEKLVLGDKCIYLHCPNGYGKTKLSNVFIEKKLNVLATTRNLKSVNKLCELAN